MSNTSELESINSVCTTSEELIKSEDFMRWITIILERVKTFNKDYILSLFTKLQNSETLDEEEREDLKYFVSDSKVSKLWQELLSKLENVSVNVKTENRKELISFSNLLEEIFSEDWFKKVQSYIWEVANITELALSEKYNYTKVSIELNGETKEILLENELLVLEDNSILKYNVEMKNWEVVSSNFPKNEMSDNQLLITKNKEWFYHFGHDAAIKEAKKQWKRLPFAENDNKEFQAIIDKVWVKEFMKLFPGYRNADGSEFWHRGSGLYLWSASSNAEVNAYSMYFYKGGVSSYRNWDIKSDGLSVRCLKD